MRRLRFRIGCAILTFMLGACGDQPTTIARPSAAGGPGSANAAVATIPSRPERPNSWRSRATPALWQALVESDSSAVIGLKQPGSARGIFRGRLLISQAQQDAAIASLTASGLITLQRRINQAPAILAKIGSHEALAALRQSPWIDYIEPSRFRSAPLDGSIGCGGMNSWMDARYHTPAGDLVPWSYTSGHHDIVGAWARSRGDNVVVVILDTGLDFTQTQFSTRFNANSGASRMLYLRYTEPSGVPNNPTTDECNHGTRVAGVIGAPEDGLNSVGIAPFSDVVSIRAGSDVVNWFNEVDVYDGLVMAYDDYRAKVVQMAFGASDYLDLISDAIERYYDATDGPLYVAAIGNDGTPNARFPAEHDDVIAVVAMNEDGSRYSASNWGPSAELAAKVPLATVGAPSLGNDGPVSLSMTSAASSTISGIAALVWARHPTWSNTQVRSRLRAAASHPHSHNWQNGYGDVNAYRAVGGFESLQIFGPTCATQFTPPVTIYASPRGDGPFTYQWSTGETTVSIVVAPPPPGESQTWWVVVRDVVENKELGMNHTMETLPADDPRLICE